MAVWPQDSDRGRLSGRRLGGLASRFRPRAAFWPPSGGLASRFRPWAAFWPPPGGLASRFRPRAAFWPPPGGLASRFRPWAAFWPPPCRPIARTRPQSAFSYGDASGCRLCRPVAGSCSPGAGSPITTGAGFEPRRRRPLAIWFAGASKPRAEQCPLTGDTRWQTAAVQLYVQRATCSASAVCPRCAPPTFLTRHPLCFLGEALDFHVYVKFRGATGPYRWRSRGFSASHHGDCRCWLSWCAA